MPHIHVSAADFVVFAAYYFVLKLIVLWVQTRWPESRLSGALGALD